MKEFAPLSDLQWEKLAPLFPAPIKRSRGKPHSSWRAVVNSILFVLLTKAKWGSWPKTADFASKSAAHRWYLYWDKSGFLNQILAVSQELKPGCEIAMPQRRIHPIREKEGEETAEIPLYFEIERAEPIVLTAE